MPRRAGVSVSSKPSSRLAAAEAFTSTSSARIRCRAAFAAACVGFSYAAFSFRLNTGFNPVAR